MSAFEYRIRAGDLSRAPDTMQVQMTEDRDRELEDFLDGLHTPGPVMRWGGEQDQMLWYPSGSVVRDDGWTMVCTNPAGCTEKAGPVPVGDAFLWWGGTPSTDQATSVNVVYYGIRIEADVGGYITHILFYADEADAAITYQPILVMDPLGGRDEMSLWSEYTASVVGWVTLTVSQIIVPPGAVFDYYVRKVDRRSTLPDISRFYSYLRSNALPDSGEVTQPGNGAVLNFSYTDDDGGDATADLRSVSIGDVINAGGVLWSVVDITDVPALDYIEFAVSPTVRLDANGRYLFTINRHAISNVQYRYTPAANPRTQSRGFVTTDPYDPNDITLDMNAYGVDLTVQDAYVPTEWEVVTPR